MQPYQQASEEINRQATTPLRTLKNVGSLAGGATIAGKIIPFLSKHIPGELMRKGLSKIEPRLGKFLEGALSNGYGLDEIRSFMTEKFSPKQEEKPQNNQHEQNPTIKQAKDFETSYPDIVKALMDQINKGQTPEAAAAILKMSTPFSQKIKKIEKDSGKNFVDFVLEMMGGNTSSQMQQQGQSIPGGSAEGNAFSNLRSQGSQQTQQPSQGGQGLDPQLAKIMQGIRGTIQGLRGGNG